MRIWALLLALLMFSSCSNDVPEEDSADSTRLSSFTIGKISGKADEAESFEKKFWSEYKNSRLFNLSTCITVKGTNVDLPDVRFAVMNMGKPVSVNPATDNKGCLNWHFKFSFDYLADETFYEIPITIQGLDHYQGKAIASIAINPWTGEVFDLEHERTSHSIVPYDTPNEYSLDQSLYVQGLRFEQMEKKPRKIGDGQFWEISYNLEFQTFLNRISLDDEIARESISKGKYNLKLEIIEKDASDNSTHIISSGEALVGGRNGVVKTIIPMLHNTARFRNTQNETVLKFSLTPDENAPQTIKPLKGIVEMEGITIAKYSELDMSEVKIVDIGLENTQRYEQRLEELGGNGTVDRDSEFHSGMQLKLGNLDFVDHGNVNSISTESPQDKYRRFEIIGKLLNPLSLRQAEAIVDGDFVLSVQTDDARISSKNLPQDLILEPDGSFQAFVSVPYNLYERERNIPLRLHIKCLSGNWEGATVSRNVSFNPWLQKGYEADEAPEIREVGNPQLITEKVTFHSPFADTNSYLVNRNMSLSYNAVYTLETPLKFLRFKSEGESQMLGDVLTGEYEVEVLLFSPKKAEVDYENINFSEFFFLTGSRKTIKVNPTGLLQSEMRFPFLIAERPYINFKNLAVITIKPVNNSSLRPVTMTMPFFGRFKKATYAPRILEGGVPKYMYNEFTEGVLTKGHNYKINSVTKDNNLSNLEVYRSLMNQDKLTTLSINSFNKRFGSDDSNMREYKITAVDLMRFDQLDHTRVVKILKKFCHFHHLSLHSSKNNRTSLESCLDDPKSFFKATPTFHIKSLEDHNTHEYQVNGVAKATYIGKDMGQLNRGRSYFAGTGVSRYHWKGEMTSDSTEISKSVGYESRVPLFINVKAAEMKTISVFDRSADGQNQMNAYRSFTTLVKDAEYEKLSLEISANVIKCIKVYNDDIIYHVCDTLDRPYKIKENWYFIGTPLESSEGVIVDGNFRPADNLTQLIRGNYNLMRQWDSYLKVDNSYIIKYNHDIDISEGMLKFQEDERFEKVPMDNRIDNSYPGLFIPCDLEIESKR